MQRLVLQDCPAANRLPFSVTSMKITPKDAGGELDPHGATGAGNPPGE